ncbi:unnamed protein product, partial [marine sediment metagenome]
FNQQNTDLELQEIIREDQPEKIKNKNFQLCNG